MKKTVISIILISFLLSLSGCFLRFKSEALSVEAGSTYPPKEKTESNTIDKKSNE